MSKFLLRQLAFLAGAPTAACLIVAGRATAIFVGAAGVLANAVFGPPRGES